MSDTPKAPVSSPSDEYDDYLVARLALWAGDSKEAEERLERYQKPRRGASNSNGFSSLAATSANRTLQQLRRRMSEYKSITKAVGLTDDDGISTILRSAGGHLGGVIWAETDREFELRAYLLHLPWEADFYRRIEKLSVTSTAEQHMNNIPAYGDKKPEQSPQLDEASLGLEWVQNADFFMQIAVSDFCTLSARSVWTRQQLPDELVAITQPYQRILDEIDPPKS
jgi:hypothetical protein